MLLVPVPEFLDRVGVTLSTQVLERIRGSDGAELRRFLERLAARHALHQSTTECITDPCRIDDAMRGQRLDVGAAGLLVDRAAVLAARDDKCGTLLEDAFFAEAGLLTNQLELVVVADDQARAANAVAQIVA